LRGHQGTAFVLWDHPYLQDMSKGIKELVTYGTVEADIMGHIRESEPFIKVDMDKGVNLTNPIKTRLVGDYNLPNILAAAAVGNYFKVPGPEIKAAIENYSPSNSRSQLIEKGSNNFILDAYNANPTSMKAAIENFARLKKSPKILMLGGMAELGEESMEEHLQIINLIKDHRWDDVVLVGGDFLKINHPFHQFENPIQARDWLNRQNFHGAYILIKGSRNIQMEKLLA